MPPPPRTPGGLRLDGPLGFFQTQTLIGTFYKKRMQNVYMQGREGKENSTNICIYNQSLSYTNVSYFIGIRINSYQTTI